ncbi:tetratricopeptide repeat protein [bacterium]|nr:tetratricopeptide repeat protein [bacterium]
MPEEKSGGFEKIAEMMVRKLFENIESKFVYMPLALFAIFILAYPITQFKLFLYFALAFALIAFAVDWVGRWQNRQTPPVPNPGEPSYRDEIFNYLASVQAKAVVMLKNGKPSAARALTEKNLKLIDEALKLFPSDADFHALMGYTLKDIYQTSKKVLSDKQRQAYLQRAHESFTRALKLDPNNAGAHNGMGNVLFFEGKYDEAIKEHDKALELMGGHYPAADHDRDMVKKVKEGKVKMDI